MHMFHELYMINPYAVLSLAIALPPPFPSLSSPCQTGYSQSRQGEQDHTGHCNKPNHQPSINAPSPIALLVPPTAPILCPHANALLRPKMAHPIPMRRLLILRTRIILLHARHPALPLPRRRSTGSVRVRRRITTPLLCRGCPLRAVRTPRALLV